MATAHPPNRHPVPNPGRASRPAAAGRHRRATFPAVCSLLCLVLLLPACGQQADNEQSAGTTPGAGGTSEAAPAKDAPAPKVTLSDVSEGDARYRVGITYPQGIDRHQGLATELQAYTDKARADLDEALGRAPENAEGLFYDLVLTYTLLADTPELVVVAGDGSSFLGGAHSVPLIERFVWLPERGERLLAERLITSPKGWSAVSEFAREQLHTELFQRVDADEMDPTDRARILREAGKMIDAGTVPKPESFHNFEPVMAEDGRRIAALRFVFPPYQVGPYTDASSSVEVPAALLLPHVDPAYRALFVAEAGGVKPPSSAQDPLREALDRPAR